MATICETLAIAVGHHRAGRLEGAGELYQQILQADPNHPHALHLLGVIAHQVGEHQLAAERIRRAIKSDPSVAPFHSNLALACQALGKLDEAVASCESALQLKPDYADAHNNLGNAWTVQGKLEEAIASFRRALEFMPDCAEAHKNLGSVLGQQGKLDEAIDCYGRALQIKPDYAEAHSDLASALHRQGKLEQAAASCRQALLLKPDCAEAHNNLGTVLKDQRRLDEAEASYQRALNMQPGLADTYSNLAIFYEELKRSQEAESMVARGLQVAPDHPLLNLAAAMCDRRGGRCREAIDRLQRVRPMAEPNPDVSKQIMFELGLLYDRSGEEAKAFAHFTQGNRLAMMAAQSQIADAQRYRRSIDELSRTFSQAWVGSWSAEEPPGATETPVFLIGFARSGTTLLDVILESHPRIQVMEEPSTVSAMESELGHFADGYARTMSQWTAAQIEHLRATYFCEVDKLIDRRGGCVLLDKHPMNTINVGLILRVFPAAKFIVAVRHPCDVCLSCFMQNFKMNRATTNFFTLEDTTRHYARVMSLWQQYVRVLPHSHHLVRYEDLVEDFELQTRRLLRFLDLDWDDAIYDYAEQAERNRKSDTPNYSQVTQPIYKQACGRWRRYAEYFEPVMDLLEPYIEHFGY